MQNPAPVQWLETHHTLLPPERGNVVADLDSCDAAAYPQGRMTGVTQILASIERGDPHAAEQLLPLVYDELRKLAAARLAQERPGQTLQATALVHEAYLRLVGTPGSGKSWDNRGHFFAAAAEAMRRLLVHNAERKRSLKRGGKRQRVDLSEIEPAIRPPEDDLLALNEALEELARIEPQTAELVKLRYFAGFTNREAAEILGFSPRKGDAVWAYARAWLHERISGDRPSQA